MNRFHSATETGNDDDDDVIMCFSKYMMIMIMI